MGEDTDKGRATTKHNTVVDYVIGSVDLATKCCRFETDEFDPIFSDVHCKLTYSFNFEQSQTRASVAEPDGIGDTRKAESLY